LSPRAGLKAETKIKILCLCQGSKNEKAANHKMHTVEKIRKLLLLCTLVTTVYNIAAKTF
jgi:hypothetical protein